MATTIHIGISGWTYPPWRKSFYPDDLPHKRELGFASREVNSIEINGTFYALQKPSRFQKWYDETPEDFVFSVKANRYITHLRRLKEVAEPLANFFASGVLSLKEKLGPILWQFPPHDEVRSGTFRSVPKAAASRYGGRRPLGSQSLGLAERAGGFPFAR